MYFRKYVHYITWCIVIPWWVVDDAVVVSVVKSSNWTRYVDGGMMCREIIQISINVSHVVAVWQPQNFRLKTFNNGDAPLEHLLIVIVDA